MTRRLLDPNWITLTPPPPPTLITFDRLTFTNYCSKMTPGTVYSAAVNIINSLVQISRCTFKNNWNTKNGILYDGGAIKFHGEDGQNHHLTVTQSTFMKNVAKSGGAIFAESGGSVTIADSTFLENVAGDCE